MIYGDDPVVIDSIYASLYAPSFEAILQSANLYAYCLNDPIMYVDKNGHYTQNGEPPPESSGFIPKKGKNQKKLGIEQEEDGKKNMETYGCQINQIMAKTAKMEMKSIGMCKEKMAKVM